MEPIVVMAARAATTVGQEILKAHQQRHRLEFDTTLKGEFGLEGYVTRVDHYANEKLVQLLQKSYPSHGFITEEGEVIEGRGYDADWQWLIDPLDGTTNFVHGIPHFCISIAVQHKGVTQHGVIYDPVRDEMFTASKGRGAVLNQRRLRVSTRESLKNALIMVGQPTARLVGGQAKIYVREHFNALAAVSEQGATIRRSASAALDLAYVAAGRADAYFEVGIKPWDIAAGELMVREAGGVVVDAAGGESTHSTGQIFAAPIQLLKPMMQTVVPELTYL